MYVVVPQVSLKALKYREYYRIPLGYVFVCMHTHAHMDGKLTLERKIQFRKVCHFLKRDVCQMDLNWTRGILFLKKFNHSLINTLKYGWYIYMGICFILFSIFLI
jgi:hypothetical protein